MQWRGVLAAAVVLGAVAGARPAPAQAAADWDGIAVELTGFTPPQTAVLADGFALFGDLAAPVLRRPARLRVAAVPGVVSTTWATWRGSELVDVWVTFGTERLGVAQVVHELIHVTQLLNPAWGDRERAFAAAHPYPAAVMDGWLAMSAPWPESEYVPRIVESLYEGGGMRDAVLTQPEAVRWALWALATPA